MFDKRAMHRYPATQQVQVCLHSKSSTYGHRQILVAGPFSLSILIADERGDSLPHTEPVPNKSNITSSALAPFDVLVGILLGLAIAVAGPQLTSGRLVNSELI